MTFNTTSHDQYLAAVGAKINAAQKDLMANGIRNAQGLLETANRIRQSADNLFFSRGREVYEPVNAMFSALSDRPGLTDVDNVAGVDVVDINISATTQSIMGYLVSERAMGKPIDTAWYQGLKATNNAGGFNQGDTVFNPFSPISNKINLGPITTTPVKAASGASELDLGTKLVVPKSVVLTAKVGDDTVTGSDLKGDGVIYFDRGGVCDKATIDYKTGKIAFEGLAVEVEGFAVTDRTADSTGGTTLKLKPVTMTATLTAKPNRIILENSFEDNAYINKQAFDLSTIGVELDFGRRSVNQLLQAFVYYLDLTAVQGTVKAMRADSNQFVGCLDLTTYDIVSSEASTKNDLVNQWVLQLNKKLLKNSGRGPTCYIVDTEGAITLGNNPSYFEANANFDKNVNGLIGTYRKIPVIRHNSLDGHATANGYSDTIDESESYGFVGAVFKDPSGQVAASMYAEYLPPYSVVPALNYDNPAQYSQALLSMSTCDVLVPQLSAYMTVKNSKGSTVIDSSN